jgi:hypothetical protein
MGGPVNVGRGISLERASFRKVDGGDPIDVMFNPKEVSVKKTVPWNAQPKPGKNDPKQQFTSGQAREISFKLEFDTSGADSPTGLYAEDVRIYINPIMQLADIPADAPADKKFPPTLIFQWGQGLSFNCVMKSVNVSYTKFNPDGIPIRADVKIDLYEAAPDTYATGTSAGGQQRFVTPSPGSTASGMSGNTAEEQQDWQSTVDNNPDAFPDGNPRNPSAGTPVMV